MLWYRSLWPWGLGGGWAGRLPPGTVVVQGYVGGGWGAGGVGGGSPDQDPARLASSPETLKGSEPEAERPE